MKGAWVALRRRGVGFYLALSFAIQSLAGQVTLEWDPNPPSENVTKYTVYYGTAPRSYTSGTLDVGTATTAVVPNLADNIKYYFAVTASNAFGESDYSDEVSTTIGANDPPTVVRIPNQSTVMNRAVGPITVTFDDVDSPLVDVIFSGSSTAPALIDASGIALTTVPGSPGSRALTLTPKNGQHGNATITIQANDQQPGGIANTDFEFVVHEFNLLGIDALPDAFLIKSPSIQILPVDILLDRADPAGAPTVTATSSNPSLIAPSDLSVVGSGSSWTLELVVGANRSGTATITVTAQEDGHPQSTDFELTVEDLNFLAIQGIQDQTSVNGNSVNLFVQLTGVDPLSPVDLELISSQPGILPNSQATIPAGGTSTTLNLTPVAGARGSTTVTLQASNGGNDTSTFFQFNAVQAHPPTLVVPTYLRTERDTRADIDFYVEDIDTPMEFLSVGFATQNPNLLPASAIAVTGSGNNRRLTVLPAGGKTGFAPIEIYADDGSRRVTASILVNIVAPPPDSGPQIEAPESASVLENGVSDPVPFAVQDAETPVQALQLSAWSEHPELIPAEGLVLAGSERGRTLTIRPAPGRFGLTTVYLRVTDGAGSSDTATLAVHITRRNVPPEIAPVPDQFVRMSLAANPDPIRVPMVVADANDGADQVVLSLLSEDPALLPATGIVVPTYGIPRQVSLQPVPRKVGSVRIVATATDPAGAQSSTSFHLHITPGAVPDLNHDGEPDLLFQHRDGNLGYWLLDRLFLHRTGSFQPELPEPLPGELVGSPDFNRDGDPDLLFQDPDGTLRVWLMRGATRMEVAALNPARETDPAWRVVATPDLNGDGHPDLVFHHSRDGVLAAWLLRDLTQVEVGELNPINRPGDDWRVVGSGNLGTGAPSELIFQHADGYMAFWTMRGLTRINAGFIMNGEPVRASSQARVVGDFDLDGYSDLLLQSPVTGALEFWLLDGGNLKRVQPLNPFTTLSMDRLGWRPIRSQ